MNMCIVLKSKIFLVLTGLCVALGVHADTRDLSIAQAIELARLGNASLKKMRLERDIAVLKEKNAWNAFLPAIALSGSLRNTHSLGGSTTVPTGTEIGASAGLSLQLQPAVRESLRQTALAREISELSYDALERDVLLSVHTAYYNLLADREGLALAEKDFQLAGSQAAYVQKKYDNGLVSELSYLQAKYAADSLEPKLMDQRRSYRQAVRNFCALIALPPDTEITLVDALDHNFRPVTISCTLDDFLARRSDVRLALLNITLAQSARTGATLNRYGPTVSLSENFQASGLQDELNMPETGTFTLSVSIPLNGYIPGSKERINAREKEAAVESATIAFEQTLVSARNEALSQMDQLDQLYRSMEITRENERIASRAWNLSVQGFESGLVDQNDLDSARQKMLNARLAVLRAGYAYKAGLLQLSAALGLDESELCGMEEAHEGL